MRTKDQEGKWALLSGLAIRFELTAESRRDPLWGDLDERKGQVCWSFPEQTLKYGAKNLEILSKALSCPPLPTLGGTDFLQYLTPATQHCTHNQKTTESQASRRFAEICHGTLLIQPLLSF